MVDVSIVIVNWNVKDLLVNCIRSIIANTKNITYEIIVVDNNSNDNSVKLIKELFFDVVILENKENKGFAKANNQGFIIAKGEFIFILNPDTLVLHDSIAKMVDVLRKDNSVGMVGPKIINKTTEPNAKEYIQLTSMRKYPTIYKDILIEFLYFGKIPIVGKLLQKKLQFPYDYNISNFVEAISGAAMLIRKDLLLSFNGFDEDFLHGGEDIFLCLQVNSVRKLKYIPMAVVIHFSGKSSSQNIIQSSVKNYISNMIYYNKVHGKYYALLYKITLLSIFIPIRFIIITIQLVATKSMNISKYKVESGILKNLIHNLSILHK